MASVRCAVGHWARQHAEGRINDLGSAMAWQRWLDDPYIAELREAVGDRPAALGFAVYALLSQNAANRDVSRLACTYLCAALLLSLADQPTGQGLGNPSPRRRPDGSK